MGLNCYLPHAKVFLGLLILDISLEQLPRSVWGDFTYINTARQDQKKYEMKLNCKKKHGWVFLLVVAIGLNNCNTNLLRRNCERSFYVGMFLLYNFLIPLINPEHNGQSWHFNRRASEWGFIIGQD